jgi:hypothetical protein
MADIARIHPGVCLQHFGNPQESLPCHSAGYIHQPLVGRNILLHTKCFLLSTLKRFTFTVIKFLHSSPFILSLLVSNSSPHSCLTLPHSCTLLLLDCKETHMHFLAEAGEMSLVGSRCLCHLTLNVRSVDRKRRDWL